MAIDTTLRVLAAIKRMQPGLLFTQQAQQYNFLSERRSLILTTKIDESVPALRLVCVETNPGPRRSQRLSEEERWRVIHSATEQHLGPSAIARKMGISKRTAILTLKKYVETGSMKDRPGRGRKRKLTKEDEKKLIKKAKEGRDRDCPRNCF